MRPVVVFLGATIAGFAGGVAVLVFSAVRYVTSPFPVSSSAGRSVFQYNDQLVSYQYYEVGLEATVIGACLILLVGAVVLGAALRARRGY